MEMVYVALNFNPKTTFKQYRAKPPGGAALQCKIETLIPAMGFSSHFSRHIISF